jgi:predicted Rdx family selenoprotein|tara:strand:+ start:563 stop:760 length:198 start_codon:yes stop_codon:yes gene_type:complete
MTAEFFAEGGNLLSITVTPGDKGVLKVYVGGEKIYDKSEEDGKHPDLDRVKKMRGFIKNKIAIME